MNCIEDIVRELQRLEDRAKAHSRRLERERGEILDAMSRAQESFGGQEAGQELVLALSQALNRLIYADGSLYELQSEIRDAVRRLQR